MTQTFIKGQTVVARRDDEWHSGVFTKISKQNNAYVVYDDTDKENYYYNVADVMSTINYIDANVIYPIMHSLNDIDNVNKNGDAWSSLGLASNAMNNYGGNQDKKGSILSLQASITILQNTVNLETLDAVATSINNLIKGINPSPDDGVLTELNRTINRVKIGELIRKLSTNDDKSINEILANLTKTSPLLVDYATTFVSDIGKIKKESYNEETLDNLVKNLYDAFNADAPDEKRVAELKISLQQSPPLPLPPQTVTRTSPLPPQSLAPQSLSPPLPPSNQQQQSLPPPQPTKLQNFSLQADFQRLFDMLPYHVINGNKTEQELKFDYLKKNKPENVGEDYDKDKIYRFGPNFSIQK